MTRPIDETWLHEDSEGIHFVTTGPGGFRGTFDAGDCARLAAQAPAMARLLARAISEAETDAILVPNGPTVCEWDAQARAVLRVAGVVE